MYIETFESFLLQIDSSGELSVKGVKRISLCEENEVSLDCRYMSVSVRGKRLFVRLFSEEETTVSGEIENISFLWGENRYASERS